MDQTITVNDFCDLLEQEELPPEVLKQMRLIMSEISVKTDKFQANTHDLLQLAQYSPTFLKQPADRQQFLAHIMTMPVFFMTLPLGEEEADEWMKENK
ncbi:hypothetical protein [Enterobacter roggenkampii]|uniref:hypothetical protein n=1 Tax=Enterobacter roggenkampii TaxID=1812935 RepID=UPI002003EBFA|nr:hypothetical protein [Enterobacter roggenkampii]MCK6942916.1 hypothetical protein [Enterobacter roggenkampii]